jgi:hypothetical protein
MAIARTAQVDQFLDGNVFWLEEFRRTAEKMPPSDKAIIESVRGKLDSRMGGGLLTFSGGVTSPAAASEMEQSLRDSQHVVLAPGSGQLPDDKAPYNWSFSANVVINPEYVRESREFEFEPTLPEEMPPKDVLEDEPIVSASDDAVESAASSDLIEPTKTIGDSRS